MTKTEVATVWMPECLRVFQTPATNSEPIKQMQYRGQQHATMLGPSSCVCPCTTTMLALIAFSFRFNNIIGAYCPKGVGHERDRSHARCPPASVNRPQHRH